MPKAIPESARLLLLENMRAGELALSALHLFQNDITPGPFTAIGDLTEADYSGYLAIPALAFGAVYVSGDGGAKTTLPSQQFDHSGGIVANDIYGWYLTDAGGALLMAQRFDDAPIEMSTASHSIIVLLTLGYGTAE